jgi:hypothetical protein
MLSVIKRRLGEPSTWKAIISLISALGIFSMTGVQIEAAATAAGAVYAFLSLVMPDKFGGGTSA